MTPYDTFLNQIESLGDDDRNRYLTRLWSQLATTEEYQALLYFLQNEHRRYMHDLLAIPTPENARTHAAGCVYAMETVLNFIQAAPRNLLEPIPLNPPESTPPDAGELTDEELIAQEQPWDRMEDFYGPDDRRTLRPGAGRS